MPPEIPYPRTNTRSHDIPNVRWQGGGGTVTLCRNDFPNPSSFDGEPYLGRLPGRVSFIHKVSRGIRLFIEESSQVLRQSQLCQSLGVLDAMQFRLRPSLPTDNFFRSRRSNDITFPYNHVVMFTWPTLADAPTPPILRQNGQFLHNMDIDDLIDREVDIVFTLMQKYSLARPTHSFAVARIVHIILV
ncbi:hypothetical protein BDN72DRAFT_902541 [Pluteus cervinus]|uniref:Uncharacterized protein n=1 Tax=Pluteus cervinus TaxID=181527 RepID=A0ACD3AC21_9AGAR|nr:hypothetical protein BDN72DRAFT_902541 [Pluteus cervinus]